MECLNCKKITDSKLCCCCGNFCSKECLIEYHKNKNEKVYVGKIKVEV